MRVNIPSCRVQLLVLAMAPMAGCDATDPLLASGHWQPIGANEANLVASIENPADLVRGRSDPDGDPVPAVAAVLRYRMGTVKPLPDSGLSEIKLAPSGTPAPTVAAPAPTSTAGGADGS